MGKITPTLDNGHLDSAYTLGIDSSTQGVKAVVCDADDRIVWGWKPWTPGDKVLGGGFVFYLL